MELDLWIEKIHPKEYESQSVLLWLKCYTPRKKTTQNVLFN